jgi:hypothetical protein
VTDSHVNREPGRFSAAIRPNSTALDGQIAQQAGRMAVVPDDGEPLSPQAADLVRRIARVILDEPADLMAEIYAAVSAAADEPLRSEPVLAGEVAASTRSNVLACAAGIARDPGGRVPAQKPSAAPPSSRMARPTAATCPSPVLPLTATAKPSRARRRAIAAPRPRELPVTRATRPRRAGRRFRCCSCPWP